VTARLAVIGGDRRGIVWGYLGRGPDWCVMCKADLEPLPAYVARHPNPVCGRRECRREWRRAWFAYVHGERTCPGCGGFFSPLRRDALYCGDRCRQRGHRERMAQARATQRLQHAVRPHAGMYADRTTSA
jgi:hypothetical protein